MSWNLWLDDQINDPSTPARWTPKGFMGVGSVAAAISAVESMGIPDMVSLDDDMGEGKPTGLDFLKWLSDNHFNHPPRIMRVHSANPVGRENMLSYIRSWRKALED